MKPDINENAFVAAPDKRVSQGECVVMRGEKVVYAGPVSRSTVEKGDKMYLNPVDFQCINEWMRKKMH